VSGATTTRVASAAAMCLSNVLLIFMSEMGATASLGNN
jgi:hypothetical protein